MIGRTLTTLGATTAMMALSATPARAQDAPKSEAAPPQEDRGAVLGEIVVTAQKREQNLQRVGIAITAVTADGIRTKNITSSADLASRVVGLESYSPYGPGSSANVVIRGIGLNDFGEGHEAPVTSYVDEFYIVSVPAVDFALFDLDRAEVLRGPQGTLFGRNSTGGLVNYVTKKPTQELSGFLSATYGRFHDLTLEAGASAPLAEGLSVRLSGFSRHSDGFQRNVFPGRQRGGQAGTDAGRIQLRYQADNGWDVQLKGEYGRTRMVHSYYETVTGYVDASTGLVVADPTMVDAAGYAERNSRAVHTNVADSNDEAYLRSSGFTGLLRIEKHDGPLTFTSLTGYQSYRRAMREDSDGTPNPLVWASFPYQAKEVSQEFRTYYSSGSTRATVGLFGLHAIGKDQPNAVFNFPLDPPTSVDPSTGLYNGPYFPLALNADWRLRTNSVAAFAQVEQDVSDQITVIAGGRLTYDDKSFADADNAAFRSCSDGQPDSCFLVAEGGTGTARPFQLGLKKALFSGKLQLDYKPDSRTLFYASVSRGTKAGGFNNGFYPSGISLSQIPYGAETLDAYEIGEKTTLFDRRLRINSTAFYYDYRNFQTFNYVGVAGLLTNQDARAYGIETEIDAAVTRSLRVHVSGAYLHTKIMDVAKATPSGATVVADRSMAFAPSWSAGGGVTYTRALGAGRELTLDWNFDARTSRFAGNFGDPGTELEGYFRHNASATIDFDRGLQLRGFVDNISNRRNLTYAGPSFASIGIIQVRYAMPRTYGVALRYAW